MALSVDIQVELPVGGNEEGTNTPPPYVILNNGPTDLQFLLQNATNNTNVTLESTGRDEALARVEIAVLATIFVLAVVGNACVLVALIRKRTMSRMNMFILHLSLADLLVAFLNILPQLAWDVTGTFHGGDLLCRVVKFLQVFVMYLSTYVLVMTALDRYRAICFPLSYYNGSSRVVRVMISVAYLLSALFSIPQPIFFKYNHEVSDCWAEFDPSWMLQVYVISFTVLVYIIPFLILLFAYTSICYTIWANQPISDAQDEASRRHHVNPAPPNTLNVFGNAYSGLGNSHNWISNSARNRSLNGDLNQRNRSQNGDALWRNRSLNSDAGRRHCLGNGYADKTPAGHNCSRYDVTGNPQIRRPCPVNESPGESRSSSFRLRRWNFCNSHQHNGHAVSAGRSGIARGGAVRPRVNSMRGYTRARLKTVKLTAVVIVAYLVCWSPFFVSQLWWAFDPSQANNKAVVIMLLLSCLNSCCNPWIYLAFSGNLLRQLVPRAWQCIFCCPPPPVPRHMLGNLPQTPSATRQRFEVVPLAELGKDCDHGKCTRCGHKKAHVGRKQQRTGTWTSLLTTRNHLRSTRMSKSPSPPNDLLLTKAAAAAAVLMQQEHPAASSPGQISPHHDCLVCLPGNGAGTPINRASRPQTDSDTLSAKGNVSISDNFFSDENFAGSHSSQVEQKPPCSTAGLNSCSETVENEQKALRSTTSEDGLSGLFLRQQEQTGQAFLRSTPRNSHSHKESHIDDKADTPICVCAANDLQVDSGQTHTRCVASRSRVPKSKSHDEITMAKEADSGTSTKSEGSASRNGRKKRKLSSSRGRKLRHPKSKMTIEKSDDSISLSSSLAHDVDSDAVPRQKEHFQKDLKPCMSSTHRQSTSLVDLSSKVKCVKDFIGQNAVNVFTSFTNKDLTRLSSNNNSTGNGVKDMKSSNSIGAKDLASENTTTNSLTTEALNGTRFPLGNRVSESALGCERFKDLTSAIIKDLTSSCVNISYNHNGKPRSPHARKRTMLHERPAEEVAEAQMKWEKNMGLTPSRSSSTGNFGRRVEWSGVLTYCEDLNTLTH